jgi:uncharacterized RmlC-like cupin family protein
MIGVYPFHEIPNDPDYEPPIDLRWGITDELCGARHFCSNRVIIPPQSNNQHHYHLGCEALIYFTHGNWEVYQGIDKKAKKVGPGSCVYIPVGEPHSYANLDTTGKAAYELAFYGMIPHRRFAETIYVDGEWKERGKIIQVPSDTEQVIDSGRWKPSDSEGPIILFSRDDGIRDDTTIPGLSVRWLVTKGLCKSRELLGGVGTMAPRSDTGFVKNEGAEMMFYLFTGLLEVQDQLGRPQVVPPETFVYLPQHVVWRVRNVDQWHSPEFYICCGGINTIEDIKPRKVV